MRVIAGRFGGRRLSIPRGAGIRPTAQKVKEALFSILGEKIDGASFLELFAGGGNVGIEAISRGAAKVVFVENNRACLKTIGANLDKLGISYNYGLKPLREKPGIQVSILALDAQGALRQLEQNDQKFDLVFLDPPYYQNCLKNALIKISHYDILRPRAFVISEHSKRQGPAHHPLTLKLILSKDYGDTALSFYQKEAKS